MWVFLVGCGIIPHVCVVFILNRSFYPTTSVHPVSVLVLHPKEIQNMWSQSETEKSQSIIWARYYYGCLLSIPQCDELSLGATMCVYDHSVLVSRRFWLSSSLSCPYSTRHSDNICTNSKTPPQTPHSFGKFHIYLGCVPDVLIVRTVFWCSVWANICFTAVTHFHSLDRIYYLLVLKINMNFIINASVLLLLGTFRRPCQMSTGTCLLLPVTRCVRIAVLGIGGRAY